MIALLVAALLAPQDSSVQRLRAGQEKVKVRDFDGAIPDFERCLQLQPEEYNANFGLGICFYEKEEYKKASDHFARVVALVEKEKPGAPLPGVHQKLLGCAILLEDYDAAVREASHLIGIQATGEYYYTRALARRRKGEAKAAAEDCDAALKEDPLLVKARTLKGEILLSRGETEPALAEFAAAIQARASSREGYLGRACALYRLERWADALADLATAKKVNRGQGGDLVDRAVTAAFTWLVQTRAGRKEAAADEVRSYRAALKELGKDPAKNHLLALPLYLAGELPESALLQAASAATARKVQALCEAHFYIGERKLLEGDAAGARDHFRRCVAEGVFESELATLRLKSLEK